MERVHVGEMVRRRVVESGFSVAALARSIHCSRSNIYSLYKRKSIDIEQLLLLSKVLNYDFVSEYIGDVGLRHKVHVLLIEVDGIKYKELLNDSSVKIAKLWTITE